MNLTIAHVPLFVSHMEGVQRTYIPMFIDHALDFSEQEVKLKQTGQVADYHVQFTKLLADASLETRIKLRTHFEETAKFIGQKLVIDNDTWTVLPITGLEIIEWVEYMEELDKNRWRQLAKEYNDEAREVERLFAVCHHTNRHFLSVATVAEITARVSRLDELNENIAAYGERWIIAGYEPEYPKQLGFKPCPSTTVKQRKKLVDDMVSRQHSLKLSELHLQHLRDYAG